jgi:YVTN family beta-propeller protein
VAVNPVTNQIYVANGGSNNVTVIDGATNLTTTVTDPNAKYPAAVAVNPVTNKIYVANSSSDNVTVINGTTYATTVTTTGASPNAVDLNPVTNRIYLANIYQNTVTVINGANNSTTTVSVGSGPIAVAVNPVTNKIYVANSGGASVTVIDGPTNTTTTVGAGTDPVSVGINPVTSTSYVANFGSSNVTVITEQQVSAIPLHASITPVASNTTSLTPTFTFSAASTFAPTAPSPDNLLFQVDTWQGTWQEATAQGGGSFTGTTATLQQGFHILYAYATDGQEATSTQGGSNTYPGVNNLISNITAYGFLAMPLSASAVTLSAPSITFGSELLGSTSSSLSVKLTSSGTASLTISSITITGTNPGDFALATTGTSCPYTGGSVAVNATCTIDVTFTPTAAGTRTGTVTINDNASSSPQSVGLTGTGVAPAPVAGVSPSSLPFTSQLVGTPSSSLPVTLSNTGTAALAITSIGVSGNFSESDNCNGSVATSGSCTINVTFTPMATGSLTGTLTITDNASTSPQTVSLTGTGIAPIAGVSPGSLSFGNQTVGTPSASQPVTLSNTGTAALTIASITASGDFSQTNTCAGSVAVSSSCTINVTFTPTAPGARTGTLTITDNTNGVTGSTQPVGLTGTGIAVPVAGVSPASLTFSGQWAGTTSAAQPVTLKNTGTAALAIASIAISGTNASSFAVASTGTTCSASSPVAASSSCTINVTFTPQATGSLTGTLTITDNSGGVTGSTQTVSLAGTGQDFTLAVASGSPSTNTTPRGQPATYTLALGAAGGFNQSVSITCTGIPALGSCTILPSVLTPSSPPTNLAVVVTTTAGSFGAPGGWQSPPTLPLGGPRGWWLLGLLLTVGTGVLWARRQAGARCPLLAKRGPRGRAALWVLAAGMLLTLAAAACHRPYVFGTLPGTYTMTVTGTATSGSTTLTHSVNLTLIVY